jgi:hypothetical protein
MHTMSERAAADARKRLSDAVRKAATQELLNVLSLLSSIPEAAYLQTEEAVAYELRRLKFTWAEDVPADYYEMVPIPATAAFVFAPEELMQRTRDQLRVLLRERIRYLCALRRGVRFAYVGICVWSPTRWQTYMQMRGRWRGMFEVLRVEGNLPDGLIGLLEQLGID